MLASSTAVATWMAFMLFKKRQRDEEEPAPDLDLQGLAAIGSRTIANSTLAGPEDPEAAMPRWRRPSLIAARKIDPTRSSMPERPNMTFAAGSSRTGVPVVRDPGFERLTVRYAVATLLNQPDEIMGLKLGELVAGDEVQVEDRMGAYVQVLRPDGLRGWVHRTTLGKPLDAAAASTPTPDEFAPPVDVEDALAALLAARSLL
ncbi:MAG: SH3 domain-containing protein [Gemmatimonadales bacterium]